jgi:DNA-binding MarR family transcriptional regulator
MADHLSSGPMKVLLAIRICELTKDSAEAHEIAFWSGVTPGYASEKCRGLVCRGYAERIPPPPGTVGKGGRQTWRLTPAGRRKSEGA